MALGVEYISTTTRLRRVAEFKKHNPWFNYKVCVGKSGGIVIIRSADGWNSAAATE